MKPCIRHLFLLPALIAGLGLMPAGRVTAQTFTMLHSFAKGSDGYYPIAGLILSGKTLYGTTMHGGSSGNGTVFAVNTDGSGFTNLHSFTATSGFDFSTRSNSDGIQPWARVILSANTLYGTAAHGGSSGAGTVFALNTDGTGFTTLHSFTGGSDGASPLADLILSGNTLYGTTESGGWGTVFKVNSDGTGFTTLHSFSGSEGAGLDTALILSGNTLYGTTYSGGSSDTGTVFALNTDGTGFTTLHSFTPITGSYPYYINSDGRGAAISILVGNTLYGTASKGGSTGRGTVFKVNSDGTGFTTLYNFTEAPRPAGINSGGAHPLAGVILSGNTLYGMANGGGSSGYGTVFALNTDGTGFTNLHDFTSATGVYPRGGLLLSGNTLYGTANGGGSSGYGTVFSLSLPPPPTLGFTQSGNELILSWPTDAAFSLQSAPFVTGTYTNVTGATSPYTNSMSGPQQYFRLQSN